MKKLTVDSIRLDECVIFHKLSREKTFIGKNRDRGYESNVRIERVVYNDIEIVMIVDEDTMWMEGLNSAGIGIVNSALAVGFDEKAKKIAKKTRIISKDGIIIRQALKFKKIDDVVLCLRHYMGGVKGHTIVADPHRVVTIESATYHNSVRNDKEKDSIVVRTNHAHELSSVGYTYGDDFISSTLRRDQMISNLTNMELKDGEAFFKAMSNSRYKKTSPYNVKRDQKEGLSTTNQYFYVLDDLELHFNMIPSKGNFIGSDEGDLSIHDLLPEINRKIKVLLYKDGKFIKEI